MYRIDDSTATASKPARGAVGPKPNGFFQDTDPAGGTIVDADFMNAVQDEIAGFIESRGITLDKTDDGQLEDAIVDALKSATDPVNPFMNYAKYRYEVTSGTTGTAYTTGLNTISFNTEEVDNIGITLSANKFTVPAGTYRIVAKNSYGDVSTSPDRITRMSIYDETAGATAYYGRVSGGLADVGEAQSEINAEITLSVSSVIRVDQRFNANIAAHPAVNDGGVEVYSEIEIWKLD